MSGKSQDDHWTYTLFQENAHLYLPFLEQAKERAPDETNILAGRGMVERVFNALPIKRTPVS